MRPGVQYQYSRPVARKPEAGILALIVAVSVLFFCCLLFPGWLQPWIAFSPASAWVRPWTFLSGALLETSPLGFFVCVLWLWTVGGSLDRALGWRSLAGLILTISLSLGFSLILANWITGIGATSCLAVTIGALTVAWGLLNSGESMFLWGIVQVPATILAVLGALFPLLRYGLPVGLFALSAGASAWVFITYRRRRRRYAGVRRIPRIKPAHRSEVAIGLGGRIRAWRDNRRLERLLKNSGLDKRE